MSDTKQAQPSKPQHAQPPKQKLVTPRRIVISLLLAFALALFGYGFSSGKDPEVVKFSDSAVEATEPEQGGLSLRQSRIGIDLVVGHTAELAIDGTPVPADE